MKKRRTTSRKCKAVTLVEILVVIIIAAIILAALWSGVLFSKRTVSDSVMNSDSLELAREMFLKTERFVSGCISIDYPLPFESSSYAILTDQTGKKWILSFPDRNNLLVREVYSGASFILETAEQSLIIFEEARFFNVSNTTLRLTVRTANENGTGIAGLSTFSDSFEIGSNQ